MKYDWLDEYLLSKKGVTKDFKIEWNWIRYQIGGKLFVAVCFYNENNPHYITLKLKSEKGEFFGQQCADIIPRYFLNKLH